jgi:glycosyltransferase involved in cell wall biosynthesis
LLSHIDRARFTPIVLLPKGGPMERELQRRDITYRIIPYDWWLAQRNWLPIFVCRMLRSLVTFGRLTVVARRISPDLIYSNSLVIPQGALLAAVLRRPHIWHVRELVSGNETLRGPLPLSFILWLTVKLSSQVIAISESVRSQFPQSVQDRVMTIYDGVDVSCAPDDAPIGEDTDDGAIRLAVIGTLSEAKGQLVALETVRQLKGDFPTVSLSVVGAGKPAFQRRLEDCIKQYDLATQVTMMGHHSDIAPILQATDLLLMPSRAEAFGLVTVEALGAGIPVVGTNSGGTPEILAHGGGVLVPPERPDLMADAVRELLRSPERLNELRRRTRRTAEQFTASRNAELVQREIQKAVRGLS